jgi:hypothetical protein
MPDKCRATISINRDAFWEIKPVVHSRDYDCRSIPAAQQRRSVAHSDVFRMSAIWSPSGKADIRATLANWWLLTDSVEKVGE